LIPQSTSKANVKYNKIDLAILKENGMLLVKNTHYSKLTKAPYPGFVSSSKSPLKEENNLSRVLTGDRFDSNAYKLTEKSSCDLTKSQSLGHVIEVKPYG